MPPSVMTNESELLDAIASATDAADAERLYREATRQAEESKNDVSCWRAVELRAERKWGELLGPSPGAGRPAGNVSSGDIIPHADRVARSKARAVAAVPAEIFEAYMTEMKEKTPSRAGLLRIVRQSVVEQAIKELTEAGNGKTPSIRAVQRKLGLPDDRTLRKDWDALAKLRRAPARPVAPSEAPPKQAPPPKNWNEMSNAARQREIKRRLKERGEWSGYMDLLNVSAAVSKACSALEGIQVEDYDFTDEQQLWKIEPLIDDLITLGTWQQRQLSALQGRMSDMKVLDRIAKLRNAGDRASTTEEGMAMHAMADRLERNREQRLAP